MRSSLLSFLFIATLSLGQVTTAHADVYEEFAGARSLAMGGAHRGLGTSNDTLILNPAGMAAHKRYSIEGGYGYGGRDHINRLHLSAVDSKSAAFAAGVGFTRDFGNPTGVDAGINRFYFSTAYAITPFVAFGAGVRNYRGHLTSDRHKEVISLYNGILGASLNLGQLAGVGVTFENFIRSHRPELMPMRLGLGGSVHTGLLAVVGDVRWDLRAAEKHPVHFGVGGELFLRQAVALRGGYRIGSAQPTYRGRPLVSYVTGGAAFMTLHGGIQGALEIAPMARLYTFIISGQFAM